MSLIKASRQSQSRTAETTVRAGTHGQITGGAITHPVAVTAKAGMHQPTHHLAETRVNVHAALLELWPWLEVAMEGKSPA